MHGNAGMSAVHALTLARVSTRSIVRTPFGQRAAVRRPNVERHVSSSLRGCTSNALDGVREDVAPLSLLFRQSHGCAAAFPRAPGDELAEAAGSARDARTQCVRGGASDSVGVGRRGHASATRRAIRLRAVAGMFSNTPSWCLALTTSATRHVFIP